MKKISFSIIIPTLNSEFFLETCLKSIKKLNYPKKYIEVIISDNNSTDKTKQIALKYGCKFFVTTQQPPQVCKQRNIGAINSKGEYLLFLDHDMEFPHNFFSLVSKNIEKFPIIDAWSIPEKIVAHNSLLTNARNFENECAKDTIVPSFRLMKRDVFFQIPDKYDLSLSSGPGDWDMDIQLKIIGCKLKTLDTYVIHHEESLTMWSYILKKSNYVKGIDIYKKKWVKRNPFIYKSIIMKQLSPFYRGVGIYFENGKWKQTIKNLPLYFFLIFLTFMKGYQYYFKKLE
ncbi:MAG: glycosyltransferase family 2 protein [Patescibacteria group bacterium]